MMYYRLKFKNGTYSAWTKDFDRIEADAEFFNAKIEQKFFKKN